MVIRELPVAAIAVALSQDGVLTRNQALRAGLTPEQWRSGAAGRLRPLFRGCAVLVTCLGPDGPSTQQLGQAALLAIGPDEANSLCIGSALRVHGIAGSPYGDPEHVLVIHGWQPRHGIVRHQFAIQVRSICIRDGLRVTTPLRSVYDAVRFYDRAHAVSVMDSAMHLGRVSEAEVAALAPYLSPQRRSWIELTDPKAESPFESRARLLFIDRHVAFESQYQLYLPGFGAVRLDFLVGRRTGVECDGKQAHDPIAARYADSARDEALRDVNIEALHLAWRDVDKQPEDVMRQIAKSEARGAWQLRPS